MTSANEEQMQLDMTLQAERDISENVRTAVEFTQMKLLASNPPPSRVRNRHEVYGIVAENYAEVAGSMKRIKKDMDTLLGTLGDINRPALEAVSSICNDTLTVAIAVVIMAAEMQRTLSDLYEAENQETHYPMDDLSGTDGDGFEEAAPLEPEDSAEENETEDN
ncbi:MAG: hypothetical protein K2O18_06200 [Oscillospiraceae bacterium]|nr:hypothetical protein [Oscillospiraceae bacterium]